MPLTSSIPELMESINNSSYW